MESELVSGFMTEHAAVIFVFFFLAEYASIVLICILSNSLFFGGYLLNWMLLIYYFDLNLYLEYITLKKNISFELIDGMFHGLSLGFKSALLIFIFIWVRASFPRIRFDQLMLCCWIILLPVVICFIFLVPCYIYSLDMITCNITLF